MKKIEGILKNLRNSKECFWNFDGIKRNFQNWKEFEGTVKKKLEEFKRIFRKLQGLLRLVQNFDEL